VTEASFRIDLHVHTGRYSQCAEFLNPYEAEDWAIRAGLSGIVITEHDILWHHEEVELLRERSSQIRIYRGVEVSARGCHLVVIGIDDAGPLHRGIGLKEVAGYAERHGAAVILAHPYRDADPGDLPVELVTAIEVGSTSFTADEASRARRLARKYRKPTVAASDAHALSRIGWAWTAFPFLPGDERELAAAIRSGRGAPVVPYPFPG